MAGSETAQEPALGRAEVLVSGRAKEAVLEAAAAAEWATVKDLRSWGAQG